MNQMEYIGEPPEFVPDENKIQFGLFDGRYGRVGRIWIELNGHCDMCGKDDRTVFCSDGSDEEYNSSGVCEECVRYAFDSVRDNLQKDLRGAK